MQKYLHVPTSSIAEYVAAIWQVDGDVNASETILPKGVVEIIFNFAEQVTSVLPFTETPTQAPRCFIQGMNTQVVEVSYSGRHSLFGLRLHPHRVREFLGILPAELVNTTLDLAVIKPWINELWHRLAEIRSFAARSHLVETELPGLPKKACERSEKLCSLFYSGGIESFQTVTELAKQVCYSTRQLSRVTHQIFGLPAEELAAYKRFLHSVNTIHFEKRSFTDVAYESGFYDQAHFCHVFKSYTGMTPKQYRELKSDLPFHIFPSAC